VAGYIVRRIILLIPVMLVVGTVSFVLLHLTPGDPAAVMLGPEATAEEVQELRDRLGLNDSLFVQYARWIGSLVTLDLGDSLFLDRSVRTALFDRLAPTLQLTLYSFTLAILLGIPAGVCAALWRDSLLDRVLMTAAVAGSAVPGFVLGIGLIYVFAVQLGWLPTGGYVPFTTDPVEHIRSMVLPVIALGFTSAALPARLVRSSMLDVLSEDYVRTAVAKGLSPRAVAVRHALRTALLPAITVLALRLADLLGGAVIVETVFQIPGMGSLIVNSIARRDFPVIQGAIMLVTVIYLLCNLLADILYVYADPRVRYGRY
jgi:peptide/nickel transport system permease protein